jgi:hypothetical protein
MDDRRRTVDFDPERFARLARAGEPVPPIDAFRQSYEQNLWGGAESVSGPGSSLSQTARIRAALPALCSRLGVTTLLDVPCGDFHWMSQVALPGIRYIGGDLLPEVVAANTARYGTAARTFLELDLTRHELPPADLLLCRDCLVHLSFADITRVLRGLTRAPVTWLLTTTFPDERDNQDIRTGDWRPLNLARAPFDFPPPVELLNEGCTEQDGRFADKSLGLWRIGDLPR